MALITPRAEAPDAAATAEVAAAPGASLARHADTRANRRGIRLMLLAMACFITNDTLVKGVAGSLPAGQLILVRGVVATTLVLLALRASGVAVAPRRLAGGWVALRAGIDAVATLAFLIALFNLPLANATAINMASPLFITLLAVLWLGERVTRARALATTFGFIGVLAVIQPRLGAFNGYAWLCLTATALHSVRDIITRRIAADVPALGITLATAVAVTATAALITLVQGWQPLALQPALLLAAAGAFLAGGYYLVVQATRYGDLAVVAPFRYSGLLMALVLGWAVWGEVPNALAWGGIALVIGAGLYLLRSGAH